MAERDGDGEEEELLGMGTPRVCPGVVEGGPVAERRVGDGGGREVFDEVGERGVLRFETVRLWPEGPLDGDTTLPTLSALATLRASLTPLWS